MHPSFSSRWQRVISLLCATVAFQAKAIESEIVGYQIKSVRQYLSVQLATFDDVGTEGMDIQNIKPVAAEGEEVASGDFTIQIYGNTGIIQKQYMYVLGEDIDEGYEDGWYEEDWETPVEKTFGAGEAFNVYMAIDGAALQYAGQVNGEETSIPVRQYLSAQGNIRPVSVGIQSIIPVAEEGEEIESGDFTIQIYSDTGIIQKQYMYVLGEDIDEGYEDGWYEEDWETIVDKTFEAGEGFNVYAAKAGYLKFPAL